uniref:Uncharacterized protein n=1 Tax=Acrobeloides nanus TaxID=290746 RepID=A0A914DV24_9BILA
MFIFPAGFAIAYVPPYVMPCCKIFYTYQSFSINYYISVVYDPIQDKYVLLHPVTYEYVHRPLFIIATIIPIVCYTYVRKAIQKTLSTVMTFKKKKTAVVVQRPVQIITTC